MEEQKHYFQLIVEGDYSDAEVILVFKENYTRVLAESSNPKVRQWATHPKIADALNQIRLENLANKPVDYLFEHLPELLNFLKSQNSETIRLSKELIQKYIDNRVHGFDLGALGVTEFLKNQQYSENKLFSNNSMRLFLEIIRSQPLRNHKKHLVYFIECQNSDDSHIRETARRLALNIDAQTALQKCKAIINCLDTSRIKGSPLLCFKKGGDDAVRLAEEILFKVNPEKFENKFEYFINSQKHKCPNIRSVTEKLVLRLSPEFLETKLDFLFDCLKSKSANVRILVRKLALLVPSEDMYRNMDFLLTIMNNTKDANICSLVRQIMIKASPIVLVMNSKRILSWQEFGQPKIKKLTDELLSLANTQRISAEKCGDIRTFVRFQRS